ncbi:MAG: RDD family protein [Verrucomicrobiota bacterium]
MEINYKIIGGDGREYGPVTLDELKGWVRDGRVGRQTQILRSDMGSWLPAAQFAELQTEIAVLQPALTGVEGDFEPVGFWPRLGATVVDRILLYLVFFAIARMMGWPMNLRSEQTANVHRFEDLIPLLAVLAKQAGVSLTIHMIYEVLMTGKFGATLGKMIIGARIVRLDNSKLGYKYAFYRFLGKILSDLIFYIGYIFIAFREDKRALHDLLAKTRVIYKR